jgi:hypothetical protein
MDETIELNNGHYPELLDRVHIASSYLQMAIGDHPVVLKHPELNVIYTEAVDRLESLYQAIGQLDETWT